MIKIVASIKEDGKTKAKQFSTGKNRFINIHDLEGVETWIEDAVRRGHLVQVSYKIKFNEGIDKRYCHIIGGISNKTFIKHENMIRNTLVRLINELNKYVV